MSISPLQITQEPSVARVLVIEDDIETSNAIVAHLRAGGFEAEQCFEGELGLRRAVHEKFDAITLDRMLPGIGGLEIVKSLRSANVETPVLMLSSLGDVNDRVTGLRAGGDDYLVKPYESSELLVRLEVLLRRQARSDKAELVLRVGDLELDLVT